MIAALFLVMVSQPAAAQVGTNNPFFQTFTKGTGDFTLDSTTRIVLETTDTKLIENLQAPAGWLEKLRYATGLNIQITVGASATNKDIVLSRTLDSDFAALTVDFTLTLTGNAKKDISRNVLEEGYKYKAGNGGLTLQYATSSAGLRAVQSITRVLMKNDEGFGAHRKLPNGVGIDYPFFRKRIVMMDVSRYFIRPEVIIGLMEKMSFHKVNVLQMHINDDAPIPRLVSNGEQFCRQHRLQEKMRVLETGASHLHSMRQKILHPG